MRRLFPLLALVAIILPLAAVADTGEPFIRNPISCPTISCLLVQILRIFLGLIAVVSTFMFIYGGFTFLTSAGNAEQVRKGKDTLLWASVGIVTVIGSWVAVRFVLDSITGST